ncbi:LPS-assembly protein [Pseudoxanthomonas taiwanensis J19]|uniref:LPS-assembly protein n=1 Tax=Pseudoxanthomonas taiwanensis J19 TaxID=935569 RepID=A0A562E007_9GAMM|nr:LPS-assembly protein [Pseudoxanthomonas taiwanensis J19]
MRRPLRTSLRLLPLALGIALALPAMADEKPLNWGLCPVGDVLPPFSEAPPPDPAAAQTRNEQPTDIEGDELSGTETTPKYQGNVALVRGDQFLGTDQLSFDTETGRYVAEGNVRYQDSGIRIVADRAEGNQDEDSHVITNIRYQLVDRRGNGGADSIAMRGPVGQMYHSTYSTCDPDQRAWELRAQRIDVDNDEGFGVARNAVLRMGRFPVLYVPWIKFPVDDRRRTGLLYPSVSNSGRDGFDYSQPIYLNLAPNYDATLSPRIMTKRGLMLDAEFRYLYEGGRGILEGGFLPDDDLRDRDRGRFRFTGRRAPTSPGSATTASSRTSPAAWPASPRPTCRAPPACSAPPSTGTPAPWSSTSSAPTTPCATPTCPSAACRASTAPGSSRWAAGSTRACTPRRCTSRTRTRGSAAASAWT